jgi:hypothetical protein
MPRHRPLTDRVAEAAERTLAAEAHLCPLDVMIDIGWIDPGAVARWRQGRMDCLEEAINAGPERIAEALSLLKAWADRRGLVPSDTAYVARTPQRQTLRFSRGGETSVEQAWRTRWISPALPEASRERLAERMSQPPELVVITPLNPDWTCHRCGGTGDLLIMEAPGPSCLRCAGLDDLEFLPSGEAALTRRARALSPRHAVVVRFSRTRRRYERQGLLLEPEALAQAQRELAGTGKSETGPGAGRKRR